MKYLFLALFSMSTLFSVAQNHDEESIFEKEHELKLGAGKLLGGVALEVTYERVLNTNMGYGAIALIGFEDFTERYSITPFFRMYFQSNKDFGAEGFFVEGFSSFYGGETPEYYTYQYIDNVTTIETFHPSESYFDIAPGIALGKKWVNTAGFVFEFKWGVGRNLLGNNPDTDFLRKIDIYVGYRF